MPSVVPRPPAAPWWKLIDWRTVAAVGLPLWAFVFGLMIPRKAASTPPEPPAVVVTPAATAPDDAIPPPREIVVREAPPAVVPVVITVPAEPAAVAVNAAPEFKLPDTELMPADKCKTFDTRVRFHRGPAEAAAEAKASKKMMFVLHISGNFEDPGFTWNNAQALRAGALSDDAVGDYLAENFEATYQKVGTFRIVNGQKQGGNVASYFCLSDGTVVHAVAGPVDARQFLREARWAVDLRKLAVTESAGSVAKYRSTVRKGHLERLAAESGLNLPANTLPHLSGGNPPVPHAGLLRTPGARGVAQQGQVNLLLAYYPLAKLDQLYPIVFEQVLKERVSTLPVITN